MRINKSVLLFLFVASMLAMALVASESKAQDILFETGASTDSLDFELDCTPWAPGCPIAIGIVKGPSFKPVTAETCGSASCSSLGGLMAACCGDFPGSCVACTKNNGCCKNAGSDGLSCTVANGYPDACSNAAGLCR